MADRGLDGVEGREHNAWRVLLEAVRSTMQAAARVGNLDRTAMTALISKSLGAVETKRSGLQALLMVDPYLTLEVLDQVVAIAAQSHRDALLARQVVGRLDRDTVREQLRSIILNRLGEADDDEYRRLAELLRHIGDASTLDELTARALASTDPKIREVGDDFKS